MIKNMSYPEKSCRWCLNLWHNLQLPSESEFRTSTRTGSEFWTSAINGVCHQKLMGIKSIILLTFFVLPSFCFAQTMKEWVLANYTKREVMIPMRDGIRLFTQIYEPKDKSTKHPILAERTPYTCAPYGDEFSSILWENDSIYTANKYIRVIQDVRGKNHSEGVFEEIRPVAGNPSKNKKNKHVDETTDTYDTTDWLIKNIENNNGSVGYRGTSYRAFYSTLAGLSNHPAVKAISPQAPVTNWWIGDDIHHNGAFMMLDVYSFFPWFSRHNILDPFDNTKLQLRNVDTYTRFLEEGALKHLTSRIDTCPLWSSTIAHPDYDEWWQQRDALRCINNVKPAVMVVGGEFDAEDCWGALNTYHAFHSDKVKYNRDNTHLVYGPWSHGAWCRGYSSSLGDIVFGDTICWKNYFRDTEYPFFAYYLEGKGVKPVSVKTFSTGDNKWHSLNEWPLTKDLTPYYIHSGGKINTSKPTSDEKSDTYTSDPAHPVPYQAQPDVVRGINYMCSDQRFASSRPDVLTYQTDALTDTLRLAGPIDVDLNVCISTTDADFVVKIIDVFPDGFKYDEHDRQLLAKAHGADAKIWNEPMMSGYQMMVRGDIFRGRYRNSFSSPEPFTPNEPSKVHFTLNDVCHTYLPGHRLMVQIQSSWYPLADMNPQQYVNIYQCNDSDFIKSDITIFHSAEHPSHISLPVVTKFGDNVK